MLSTRSFLTAMLTILPICRRQVGLVCCFLHPRNSAGLSVRELDDSAGRTEGPCLGELWESSLMVSCWKYSILDSLAHSLGLLYCPFRAIGWAIFS